MQLSSVPALLLPWYAAQHRALPWRRDCEPYHIWISEIMLQQTRAEAVRGYYARFLEALPDIPSLAACEDDRLHKLWEGLGYYSRVRNLKKAAQKICAEHGGVFPRDYASVRSLPGIGDYTAGAICSICFGLPTPAVDGNVLRAVARLTALQEPVTRPQTKREIAGALAGVYTDCMDCGTLTQALIELGATVCVPNGEPDCGACPLRSLCESREEELWRTIPVRDGKRPRRQETRTVLLLRCEEQLAIRKRGEDGLLAGLWEFPNVTGTLSAQEALELAAEWGCRPKELRSRAEKRHIFTHVEWEMTGYLIDCGAMPDGFVWADSEQLDRTYSLPTAFRQFRENTEI